MNQARVISLVVTLALTGLSHGQTSHFWANSSGGSFANPANWNPQMVPTSNSGAQFAIAATYTVTIPNNLSVDSIHVNRGDVTFDGQGRTLTILSTASTTNPGFYVRPLDAPSNVTATLLNGTFAANSAAVGLGIGTESRLNIGAGATLRVVSDFEVAGYNGVGWVRISNGGRLTVSNGGINVGGAQSSPIGHATVTGSNSTITTPGLYIALGNKGDLLIDAGGQVQTSRVAEIGSNGTGHAAIRGTGSVWRQVSAFADSAFYVGAAGTPQGRSHAAVLDGGTIISDVPITVRAQGVVCGNSTIQASVSNGGWVSPGGAWDESTRSVTAIGQVGTLTINGNYTQAAAARLNIELSSSGSGDLLAISGSASLNGALNVSLLGGFQPSIGDAFQILSSANRIGTFASTSLPPLASGRSWLTQYSSTGVVLTVVPTMSPATMIAAALVWGIRRRR